jgi:hypothetical protein
LSLHLRIDLRTENDDDAGNEEPHQKHDFPAEGAVGLPIPEIAT